MLSSVTACIHHMVAESRTELLLVSKIDIQPKIRIPVSGNSMQTTVSVSVCNLLFAVYQLHQYSSPSSMARSGISAPHSTMVWDWTH